MKARRSNIIVRGLTEMLPVAAILLFGGIGSTPRATAQSHELRNYELRRAEHQQTGKLVAFVDGREVNVATNVNRVWPGWHASILLYAQLLSDGREKLAYFNAVTGRRHEVTTERAHIAEVTVAQADSPDQPVLVIALRAANGIPSLLLAGPQQGVFRREAMATAGAILNGVITIRYFTADQLGPGNPDVQRLPPARTATVSLAPRRISPVGNYSSSPAAAGGKGVTLVLSENGQAVLSQNSTGAFVQRGSWAQNSSVIVIHYDDRNSHPEEWAITEEELKGIRWDQHVYGNQQPVLKRRGPQ